jgi:hypothetical protein
MERRFEARLDSNSRSFNCDSSYLAHFDIKTVTRHPSREKEGMKCGLVEVGSVRIRWPSTAFWG